MRVPALTEFPVLPSWESYNTVTMFFGDINQD